MAGRFAFLHFFIDGTTQRKNLKIQRKFYEKIKKRKMHFWTPKRLFHTKLMKKTLLYSKSSLYKSIFRISKKRSEEKVRAPQNHGNRHFLGFWGALTFPLRFFQYSEDTFIRQTF